MEEPEKAGLHKCAEELVESAIWAGHMIGCPHAKNVEAALRNGEEIPERYKPGRFIMNRLEIEKEVIKKLKAKHFNHRLDHSLP